MSKLLFGVAGFRPGGRATFVSAKVAKTIDAQSGYIQMRWTQDWEGADQLAALRQGPSNDKSVHLKSRTAGVGNWEE